MDAKLICQTVGVALTPHMLQFGGKKSSPPVFPFRSMNTRYHVSYPLICYNLVAKNLPSLISLLLHKCTFSTTHMLQFGGQKSYHRVFPFRCTNIGISSLFVWLVADGWC
jgi:hypothetical protein